MFKLHQTWYPNFIRLFDFENHQCYSKMSHESLWFISTSTDLFNSVFQYIFIPTHSCRLKNSYAIRDILDSEFPSCYIQLFGVVSVSQYDNMPKLFPPSLLECPETRTFCLQKQITDTDSLRHHLQESVCLAVDVEGCEGIGGGITSIGIAILRPTDFLSRAFPSPPFDTQDFVERYQVESHCFHLEGRTRKKPHPPFPFGCTVKTVDPGREIKSVVDGIKQRHAEKDIVLIGWHPHPREFPAIQVFIPSLFQEVVGWVDLVDVVRQTCVSRQEDLAKSWPPLCDVMLSVGMSKNSLSERFRHGAGHDAIHTIVVLARVLTRDPGGPPIELRRRRLLKQWKTGG